MNHNVLIITNCILSIKYGTSEQKLTSNIYTHIYVCLNEPTFYYHLDTVHIDNIILAMYEISILFEQ